MAAGANSSLSPWTGVQQVLSVLDCFPGVVFATDLKGALTLLHGQGVAATGLGTAGGIIGQSIFRVFENHPALLYGIGRALAGQPCTATVGFANLVMEFWCGPFLNGKAEMAGMVGTAIDITERLKTGATLRQTREMLEAVVHSTPLGLAVLDVEGKVRLWNPAAERMYGWTGDEALGRRLLVIPQDLADDDLRVQQKVFAEGSMTDWERLNLRKDGSLIPISLSGAPLHNSAGEVTGAVYLAMDLTERKQAEAALQEAKERAEVASRAKNEFLANMSHEIRTPMNAVLGMLQLALDTPITPEQEHYLTVARSGAESLMGVLNDILDFSRIESRTLALAPADFDMRTLLGETADALALQAHDKGLELTCQVGPRIPPVLNGDPMRLRQVLTNLLANAVKFTFRGEIGIVVEIESEEEDSATLRYQVTDTGIGMPPERAAAMFDPFVQGDGSSTRKFGGAGLGLAISKQLVEMMGGQIGVESQAGRGSTFWFTAVFAKRAGLATHEAAAAPLLAPVKVLVVDDNGTNRTLVGALLKSWGARCHEACDAASALTALRWAAGAGDPFRLVVVDMSLPDMSGEELGRHIAADRELQGTTLMLMTYPGQRFDAAQIRQIGFETYVWKPVLAPRLADAVRRAVCSPDAGARSVPVAGAPPGFTWQSRRRILIAEDDPGSREVALGMVQELGYDADPVNNGREALTALENVIYNGVLMDCEMPGMDGCETTARVRAWKAEAHNAAIPIIALTAHAMQRDRDKCLRAGMNDYVSKPIDIQELGRVLSRWLGAPGGKAATRSAEIRPLAETGLAFDEQGLLQRLGGSQELAARAIDRFVEETPKLLEQLKQRIDECDGSGTQAHAHRLGKAAATASAVSLYALTSAIVEAGMRGEFKRAAGLLSRAEEQFRQFTLAVREPRPASR